MNRTLTVRVLLVCLLAGLIGLAASAQLTPVGGEIAVSSEVAGFVLGPTAASNDRGEVAALWGGTCGVPGLCGRAYDAAGGALGNEAPRATGVSAFEAVPATALTLGGEQIVVWSRPASAFTGEIAARRFDLAGNPLGPEVLVASQVGRLLASPDVAVTPGGAFVVVWENLRFEGLSGDVPLYTGVAIEGRLLSATGSPSGAVFRVDEAAPDIVSGPRVAVTPSGRLVVAWQSFDFDLEGDDILVRWLDATGQPLADEFVVHLQSEGIQTAPDIAVAGNEEAMVVWESRASVGSGPGIYARRVFASGPLGPAENRLSLGGNAQRSLPAIAGDDSGRYFAAWQEVMVQNGVILGRLVSADGVPLGTPVTVSTSPGVSHTQPSVAFGGGGPMVFWQRRDQEFQRRILARRYTLPVAVEPCEAGLETLCLGSQGRFQVEVDWRNQRNGEVGTGKAIERSTETGFFWFFDAANVELVVKIIDGRGANGFFWVFYGALSDVEYTITVTDTETGEKRFYENPAGNICGRGDTTAFPLAAAAPAVSPSLPLQREAFEPSAPLAAGSLVDLLAAPAAPQSTSAATGTCTADARTLCLLDNRFRVEVDWRNHRNGDEGVATSIPFTDESGFYWFFDAGNVELVVKMLDGRSITGKFWVFYGALSDVEYTITVTDTETGNQAVYQNQGGNICGRGDTEAL